MPLVISSAESGGDTDSLFVRRQQREVQIVNAPGLNATASAKLAKLAAKYRCDVWIARNGRKVDAKRLKPVMILAAGRGSHIVVEADGPDETEALLAIVALIADGF